MRPIDEDAVASRCPLSVSTDAVGVQSTPMSMRTKRKSIITAPV
jgi:hypothetical protein